MHAVIITEYGGRADTVDLPAPAPQAGQILIRVLAAGMNPMDRAIAAGAWASFMPGTFPMVLGVDVAGTVEQAGEGAGRFVVGDRVMGQLVVAPLGSSGTYAEYVAVSADATLAHIPPEIDAAVAASAPTAGMTGLSIVESLPPLEGKSVLIVGAAGGVGSFATQFAVAAGAHVIADVRAENAERMRGYGVADTVDHTTVVLPDQIARLHPDGIDVLVDVATDADAFAALAALVRKAEPRSLHATSRTSTRSPSPGSPGRTSSSRPRPRCSSVSPTRSRPAGSSRRRSTASHWRGRPPSSPARTAPCAMARP
jgi:NADPH:quinone reductase-like Zn-dependent oxidoreductase